MKKLLCTLLSVLFLVTFMAPGLCLAVGDDSDDAPENPMRYSLTSSISAGLSISGSTAHATGNISAKYTTANCSIKVKLQKKGSDGVWRTLKSWSSSGTWSASAGGDYSVTPGSYRTCVTATVTYNGQSEHPFKYSGTRTC